MTTLTILTCVAGLTMPACVFWIFFGPYRIVETFVSGKHTFFVCTKNCLLFSYKRVFAQLTCDVNVRLGNGGTLAYDVITGNYAPGTFYDGKEKWQVQRARSKKIEELMASLSDADNPKLFDQGND